MKNVIVTLTEWEVGISKYVGAMRRAHSLANGNVDQKKGNCDVESDIMGVAGEQALAKHRNVYCEPSVNTFTSRPDVYPDFQVRTTHYHHGHLIVRPGDDPKYRYVLVIVTGARCRIVGYIKGVDAKQPKYWKDDCYMVPQSDLLDIPETE